MEYKQITNIDPLCGVDAVRSFCDNWLGITDDIILRLQFLIDDYNVLKKFRTEYTHAQALNLANEVICSKDKVIYAYEHSKGIGIFAQAGKGHIIPEVYTSSDQDMYSLIFNHFCKYHTKDLQDEDIEASLLRYLDWLEFYNTALKCLHSPYATITVFQYGDEKESPISVSNLFLLNGLVFPASSDVFYNIQNKISSMISLDNFVVSSKYMLEDDEWYCKIAAFLVQSAVRTTAWCGSKTYGLQKRVPKVQGLSCFSNIILSNIINYYYIPYDELKNLALDQLFDIVYNHINVGAESVALQCVSAFLLYQGIERCFIDSNFADIIKEAFAFNDYLEKNYETSIQKICDNNDMPNLWIALLFSVNQITLNFKNLTALFDLLSEEDQENIHFLIKQIEYYKSEGCEVILIATYKDVITDEYIMLRITTGGLGSDFAVEPYDDPQWKNRIKSLLVQCYVSEQANLCITFCYPDIRLPNLVCELDWEQGKPYNADEERTLTVYEKLLPVITDNGTASMELARPAQYIKLQF